MSLRDELIKARDAADNARQEADKAALDKALSDFADSIPNAIRGLTEKMTSGAAVTESDMERLAANHSCKTIYVWNMGWDKIKEMPGFRKLYGVCASPDCDVSLNVEVFGSDYARVRIKVDPYSAFSNSQFRDSDRAMSINGKLTPEAVTIPEPPAPPPPSIETGKEIAVSPPLKFNL